MRQFRFATVTIPGCMYGGVVEMSDAATPFDHDIAVLYHRALSEDEVGQHAAEMIEQAHPDIQDITVVCVSGFSDYQDQCKFCDERGLVIV